jgi:hypothetical protein
MAAQQGTVVWKNDGTRFVPCILYKETGGKDKVYVLQGGFEELARRAPSDYEGGYNPDNLSNGGETWCTSEELPD